MRFASSISASPGCNSDVFCCHTTITQPHRKAACYRAAIPEDSDFLDFNIRYRTITVLSENFRISFQRARLALLHA